MDLANMSAQVHLRQTYEGMPPHALVSQMAMDRNMQHIAVGTSTPTQLACLTLTPH
jgi:hypothetical protein